MLSKFQQRLVEQFTKKHAADMSIELTAGVKSSITPKEVVEFLNGLLKIDSNAINKLITTRVDSKGFEDHNSVQVNKDSKLGFMGLLNGMFGSFESGEKKGWGPIMYEEDEKGNVLSFGLTENKEAPKKEVKKEVKKEEPKKEVKKEEPKEKKVEPKKEEKKPEVKEEKKEVKKEVKPEPKKEEKK